MSKWVGLAVTGVAVLLGLFVSASAHDGFWHYFGLVFALLAALLLFRLIARAYESPGQHHPLVPVPSDQTNRTVLGGMLALGGIVLLFIASGAHGGGLYYLGLFAAILAFLYVFRLIAASFD